MKTKRFPLIVSVFIGTAVLALLVLNLTTGEKRVREQIRHDYAVADAQFVRAMGLLLGPPLDPGNHVDTLLKRLGRGTPDRR